ncbi:MAG: acetylglutamate kinase [Rhodospirillaceae bacterium]|jgi:acetylglutamate kinase|nr:acetylglutamate kinase [Rhodospirillaceae bacterium]MBT4686698.1 acetylglutamate kinase [Rhodospirillaceae bacterium]MBT5079512.1 acetylglutamate kinase [Rhodospirillaceae bacterium]MBT5523101.1 acetylglutamate kinase [Rhodospirillaceae bacterium]MBT5881501.1 acetylglutamate kinase [Rhodospirillaceae bacterium]
MTDNQQEDQLHTARTLAEALPFMRRFTGQTFVIKYGGHAMGDAELADNFARDVVLMKQVGINPVVVHGGGPQIGAMLDRLKIKSSFIDGLRVTDAETVEIVEMVLSGSINKAVVTAINGAGGVAVGISGKDGRLIEARKLQRTTKDPDSNIEKVLDLGFVGEPVRINPTLLQTFAQSDLIPVIAPIGVGEGGETYNINADTAAGKIAATLKASKLVMLTDIAGVLDGNGDLISKMTPEQADRLTQEGVIKGGMIPKLETCLDAVAEGVGAAHILDGRLPHVLLLEAFTTAGVGTMIEGGR